MTELIDVIAFLCSRYPYKDELSNARVTKMVYLADWRRALDAGEQLTDIDWEFNHYGPYVPDVLREARLHPDKVTISHTRNAFGSSKICMSATPQADWPSLTKRDQRDLLQVIESTKQLTFKGFLDLVYGTFPIRRSERYDILDLPQLAEEYWEEQEDEES